MKLTVLSLNFLHSVQTRMLFIVLALFSAILLFSLFFPSHSAFAACPDGTNNCDTTTTVNAGDQGSGAGSDIYLREPLIPGKEVVSAGKETGALGIMAQYVSMVYQYVAALSAIIAILVIMLAGFQMMVSGGETQARTDAKEMILKTLKGIAMLFFAGLLLYAINPNFYVFGGGTDTGAGVGETSSE